MKDQLDLSKNHLLDLINSLYALREHSLIAKELFASLRALVPFDAAALLPVDQRTYEMAKGHYSGTDAPLIDDYIGRFAAFDPCLLEARCPTRLNEATSLSQLLQTPAWAGAAAADVRAKFNFHHAASAVAGWRERPIAVVRLHRRPGMPDFTAQEISLIDSLAPHLATALLLSDESGPPVGSLSPGLLALDEAGDVVFSNEAAQDILSHLEPQVVRSLALAKSIWRNQDTCAYRLRSVPLTPRSLLNWLEHESAGTAPSERSGAVKLTVVVAEPIQRRHALATRLVHSRLSRREVDVALCVMRGMSNADIATELSIDEKTVKDHLRRIYGKIDVRSRTAMISKVLGLEAEIVPTAELASKTRL